MAGCVEMPPYIFTTTKYRFIAGTRVIKSFQSLASTNHWRTCQSKSGDFTHMVYILRWPLAFLWNQKKSRFKPVFKFQDCTGVEKGKTAVSLQHVVTLLNQLIDCYHSQYPGAIKIDFVVTWFDDFVFINWACLKKQREMSASVHLKSFHVSEEKNTYNTKQSLS